MSYPEPLPTPKAGPVSAAERLLSLDALRGVAVMGILVMNVYAFAMPLAAYYNPLLMGGSDALNLYQVQDQRWVTIAESIPY